MVSVRENAIRLEVGISYQWALDAHAAIMRHVDECKEGVRCWFAARRREVVLTARRSHQRAVDALWAGRIRVAAAFLCVTPKEITMLRHLARNPGSFAPAVAPTKSRVLKQEAVAVPAECTPNGFAVNAKALRQAVERVGRAVSARCSIPMLGHVLVEPFGDCLRLTATDLEISISAVVPAGVGQNAKVFTVPARVLAESIRGAKDTVTLEAVKDGSTEAAAISFGGSTKRLLTLPAEEFPALPELTTATEWRRVPGLLEAVKSVSFAVSADESREILTGVCLQAGRVATTDTHRLAVAELPAGVQLPMPSDKKDAEVIVPARAFAVLDRITAKMDRSELEVRFSATQAQFRIGGVVLLSRLIQGQFPNLEKVIPSSSDWMVEADCAELAEAVREVAPVAAENCHRTSFEVTDGYRLTLRASSGNVGTAEAALDVESTLNRNDGVRMCFNARYLGDVAFYANAQKVTIAGAGEVSPVVITAQDRPGWQCVLMPMQRD